MKNRRIRLLGVVLRATEMLLAVFFLSAACGFLWLRYSTRGLPDVGYLKAFTPKHEGVAHDNCPLVSNPRAEVVVIPGEKMGGMLRDAVLVTERFSPEASAIGSLGRWTTSGQDQRPVSLAIARTLLCGSHEPPLKHQILELRTAIQLDRNFTYDELLTIFMNREWLSGCANGVQEASRCLFQKNAWDLQLDQAAMIAGLISNPSGFSPVYHPDRALLRRNSVLDAMAAGGKITDAELASAKSQPLFH
jgi:hypothetical protein